jgi:hypothetical protein
MTAPFVRGRRLAWVRRFDDRSLSYPVREPVVTAVQGSRTWKDRVVLDQGDTGTCVAQGHSGRRAARPVEHDEGLPDLQSPRLRLKQEICEREFFRHHRVRR